jgi:hypothetical protein
VNCKDCGEPITEGERLNARTCSLCLRAMHSECSMAGADEEDVCEACHGIQGANAAAAMRALGVELGDLVWERDGGWYAYDEEEGSAVGPFESKEAATRFITMSEAQA